MFSRLILALIALFGFLLPIAAAAQGYPDKPIRLIVPFATPSGTPKPIVTRLQGELARFFTSLEMMKKMTEMGAVVDIKTPDQMRKIIPAEMAKWTRVAAEAGMKRVE